MLSLFSHIKKENQRNLNLLLITYFDRSIHINKVFNPEREYKLTLIL